MKTIKVSTMSTLTLLNIVFIVLKLCGVIDWSWWLVFLPVLIEAGIGLITTIIIIIITFINSKRNDYF